VSTPAWFLKNVTVFSKTCDGLRQNLGRLLLLPRILLFGSSVGPRFLLFASSESEAKRGGIKVTSRRQRGSNEKLCWNLSWRWLTLSLIFSILLRRRVLDRVLCAKEILWLVVSKFFKQKKPFKLLL